MPNDRAAMFTPFRLSSFGFNWSFVNRLPSFTQNRDMHRISAQLTSPRTNRSGQTMGICIALAALSWLVFGQTLWHDFVNYDDPRYVYENTNITEGLSISGIVWAFTHIHSMNWHPLTTISHMLDCQLYGLKAGWHHFTNVLLQSIAVMLLFVGLLQMTGAFWRSAFVAAVFAIHPLRVESVAWIAERKDVLSGVFFMLTLLAYLYYVRLPRTGRYLVVAFVFACGLMSKPMLVTLPFVLLLVDYWPLDRIKGQVSKRVLEKIPLIALSAVSSIATLVAQKGAVGDGRDRHDAGEDDDQRQQPIQVAGTARAHSLVDGEADQVGDGEGRRRLQEDQGSRSQDRPPVGQDEQRQEAPDASPEDAGQVGGDGIHVLTGHSAPGVDRRRRGADGAHDAISSACCASRAR